MKRILGLDVGTKRTGIAVSDPLGLTAQAVETWEHVSRNADLERMVEWAHDYDAAKIVVGLPKNMNGTIGERAEKTQKFAARLQRLLPDTEIVFWDERLTTVAAQRSLLAGNVRRDKRRTVVDQLAAVLILQGYLNAIAQKEGVDNGKATGNASGTGTAE